MYVYMSMCKSFPTSSSPASSREESEGQSGEADVTAREPGNDGGEGSLSKRSRPRLHIPYDIFRWKDPRHRSLRRSGRLGLMCAAAGEFPKPLWPWGEEGGNGGGEVMIRAVCGVEARRRPEDMAREC